MIVDMLKLVISSTNWRLVWFTSQGKTTVCCFSAILLTCLIRLLLLKGCKWRTKGVWVHDFPLSVHHNVVTSNMNFLDTYGITGTGTSTPPTVEQQPEQSLNEEVTQVIGQLGRFWGGFRKQVRILECH